MSKMFHIFIVVSEKILQNSKNYFKAVSKKKSLAISKYREGK